MIYFLNSRLISMNMSKLSENNLPVKSYFCKNKNAALYNLFWIS